MNNTPPEEFVRELTDCQARLVSFVLTLVPDREAAQEVVQNTNLILLRKADEFNLGTNFRAWAFRVARNVALAHYRDCARDRVVFDASLVEELAESAQSHAEDSPELTVFLKECLLLRTSEERELLGERYATDVPVGEMAKRRGRSANSVSLTLFRIRHKLMKCVVQKLAERGPE